MSLFPTTHNMTDLVDMELDEDDRYDIAFTDPTADELGDDAYNKIISRVHLIPSRDEKTATRLQHTYQRARIRKNLERLKEAPNRLNGNK
jgi:hypothetical protein